METTSSSNPTPETSPDTEQSSETLTDNLMPEMTESSAIPRQIVYYPSPILLTPSIEMDEEEITEEFLGSLPALFELMYKHGGRGLAAPQVGIPKRFFLMNFHPEALPSKENQMVFINPEIVELSREEGDEEVEIEVEIEVDVEGCLSLPGVFANVPRATTITVRALNADKVPFEMTFAGLSARVVQHEMDHLNGRLILEYLTPAEKGLQKATLNRLQKYHDVINFQMNPTEAPNKESRKAAKWKKSKSRVKKH